SVTLSATDTGGSGVAVTRYTTDGSDPTVASPIYWTALSLSRTTTLEYRSWDGAGNVEPTRTTAVRIDTVGPSVAITSPLNGSTISTKQTTITASGTDADSGVKTVSFYVDGKQLGVDGRAPFSYAWKPRRGQHALMAVA